MYDYITGKIISKNATHIILECGGIGYQINISLNTYSNIHEGSQCKIFTHLAIKEDAHTLYGFADEDERKMFRNLISVSGVGASTARMMLSSLTPVEIAQAIVTGNAPVLQNIKGIGSKSAQRIIIDLKDKLGKIDTNSKMISIVHNTNRDEALSALVTLGFAKNAAEKSLDNAIRSKGAELSVEDLIKSALGNL
ncbi:MAG: Holliday junction branch migration protein RuvA [Bacteroidia bacterium]